MPRRGYLACALPMPAASILLANLALAAACQLHTAHAAGSGTRQPTPTAQRAPSVQASANRSPAALCATRREPPGSHCRSVKEQPSMTHTCGAAVGGGQVRGGLHGARGDEGGRAVAPPSPPPAQRHMSWTSHGLPCPPNFRKSSICRRCGRRCSYTARLPRSSRLPQRYLRAPWLQGSRTSAAW